MNYRVKHKFVCHHKYDSVFQCLWPHSLSDCVVSSESEMEEEEEEEEERGGRHRVTSEEARASWRETLQLHLRGNQEGEEEEEGEEEDEEGGSEVESSDGESPSFLFPVL